METWKTPPGVDPRYQVSTIGRVRSLIGATPRILKLETTRGGYMRTSVVAACGMRERRLVHRMVLSAFDRPPAPGEQGCHNNGDPADNRIANLRWDTAAGNQSDRRKHGTANLGDKHPLSKLTASDIPEIRRRLEDGDRQVDIAADFGVGQVCISSVSIGRTWGHI